MAKILQFLIIFYVNFVFVSADQCSRTFQIKPEHLNKRLVGHLLFEIITSAHHDCIRTCMVIVACRSINFNRRKEFCQLNKVGYGEVSLSDFVDEPGTIFSDITQYPQTMVGGCAGHLCKESERCYPNGNSYMCKKIECGNIPSLQHGTIQRGENFAGSTRQVVCGEGYVLSGDESIICLHNGTWSQTPFCGREFVFTESDSGNFSRYDLHADGVTVDNRLSIVFQAKGTAYAFVLLQRDRDSDDFRKDVVNVNIGSVENTKLSLSISGGEWTSSVEYPDGILSPDEYRWFWIAWDNGCVKAGRGNVVGSDKAVELCGLLFSITGIRVTFYYKNASFLF